MEITVNDQKITLPEYNTITAQQLVEITFPKSQKGIALALGSSVLPREEWPNTVLQANDKVQIFKATQGG